MTPACQSRPPRPAPRASLVLNPALSTSSSSTRGARCYRPSQVSVLARGARRRLQGRSRGSWLGRLSQAQSIHEVELVLKASSREARTCFEALRACRKSGRPRRRATVWCMQTHDIVLQRAQSPKVQATVTAQEVHRRRAFSHRRPRRCSAVAAAGCAKRSDCNPKMVSMRRRAHKSGAPTHQL